MQGPDFTHLTRSYVEYLGLKPFLHERPKPVLADVQIAPGVKLRDVPMVAHDWVVVYNHGLYFREPDGLAWSRRVA